MVRRSRQGCVKNRIKVTLILSLSQSLFIWLLEIMRKQTPKLQPSGNFYTQINLASLTHSIWPFSNGFSQWHPIMSYLWAPSANRYILCQNCVWVQSVSLSLHSSYLLTGLQETSTNYYRLESFYRVHKEKTCLVYSMQLSMFVRVVSVIIFNIMELLHWRLTLLNAVPALSSRSNLLYDPWVNKSWKALLPSVTSISFSLCALNSEVKRDRN